MHLTEEDLILHYYGELASAEAPVAEGHLRECPACRAELALLQRVLAAVEAAPAPAPDAGFERAMWARLQPALAPPREPWWSWVARSPARLAWAAGIVMLVAAAFFAGRMSERTGPAVVADASSGMRERVLLSALGEHLDRSQMMLIELVSADEAAAVDVQAERMRAERLVSDNRLYRLAAADTGNTALAAVLDDLERVLVDVAASPDTLSATALSEVQRRIEDTGLLLKVRVLSSEVQKQQKTAIRARAGQSL